MKSNKQQYIPIVALVLSVMVVLWANNIDILRSVSPLFCLIVIFVPFVMLFITKKFSFYMGTIIIVAAIIVMYNLQIDKTNDIERIALLETGKITQGIVTRKFYSTVAPAGWTINYRFSVNGKMYHGYAQGPKEYYAHFNIGDKVDVIYDPKDPRYIQYVQRNNYEIYEFLNRPSIVSTIKRAGKLQLLEKFKEQYEIKEYSFEKWARQQWQE